MSAVPRLRFPGFEGKWEPVRLRDLVARMEAGAYATAESRPAAGGEKGLLLTSAVANGGFDPTEHKAVADPREAARLIEPVRAGSILVSRINTTDLVGASALVEEDRPDLFLPDRLWALTVRDGESARWVAQLLGSPAMRAALGDRSAGTSGSMKYLTRDAVLDLPLRRAPGAEQEEVADFLGAVDARAVLERRRLEALERLKAGLLRALFAGTLRFAREDGQAFPEWEEVRFGDLFAWIATNSLSREKASADSGTIQNIHYGDVHARLPSHFRQSRDRLPFLVSGALARAPREEQFVRVGDLILADASEDLADVGKAMEIAKVRPHSVVSGLHTLHARPKVALASGFAGYVMRAARVREQIMREAQGISVFGLSSKAVARLMVPLPHPDEQAVIADALGALDDRLAFSRRTADALALFKRGLLQQMFV